MIEFTKELLSSLQMFKEHFGDIVPLQEIPGSVSTRELIDAINQSIKKNHNLLPKLFGYGKMDRDSQKDV